MGWSCSNSAYETMKQWSDNCFNQTGCSNTYKIGRETYFFEASRMEHIDGAITGSIHRFVGEGLARKVGSFRINGSGRVTRGPKFLSQPLTN